MPIPDEVPAYRFIPKYGLQRLLGVLTMDEFLENIWEQATHLARGVIKDSLAEILTQDQFEILMANAGDDLSVVDGRVARPMIYVNGSSTRLVSILDAYRRGCTLLQSGLQLRWLPVAAMCREIENEFITHKILLAEAVGANAYLTPARSQGFDIHYDNHCALILQLHGSKHWTVFRPTEELPITRCEHALSRDNLGTPLLETELVSGDTLYIPRGFPHFASSGDQSSLHLTLSLRTMTWVEVINRLCLTKVAFRKSVHIPLGGTLSAQEYFDSELVSQFASMEVTGFLQHRLLEVLAGLSPVPNGLLRSIDESAAVSAETKVLRIPLVYCVSSEENGQAVLRFPGGTLRLPAAMKPVFDFVAENQEFRVSELPSIDAAYDAEELIRILIKKGLVRPSAIYPAVNIGTKEET